MTLPWYPKSKGSQKQSLPLLFLQSFRWRYFLVTCLYGIYFARLSAKAGDHLTHL